MKKNSIFNIKILIFITVILFFNSIIINSVNSIIVNTKDSDLSIYIEKNISNFSEKINQLTIENIYGGEGINLVIKNDGITNISDITVNIDTTKGLIKIITPKPVKIPYINAGSTTNVHIKLFGFEFRKQFKYNRILVNISAPNITTINRIIVANIFGSIVKIKAVFFYDEESYDGYTLFSPDYSTYTYLINKTGEIVKNWKSKNIFGLSVHLLKNGNLLRTCINPANNPAFITTGMTGRVEMFDWNNTLIWEYDYSNKQHCLHHEIEPLPNGNILMIALEVKSRDEAISQGRNPYTLPTGKMWPSYIIEVQPTPPKGGNIVWEWHIWDHMIQDYDKTKTNYGIISDHPELIDINLKSVLNHPDWNHINSLDYNEKFNQILISSFMQNEIWIIDHSTTTEEAAGHTGGKYGKGGDLLYRWGNPQTYKTGNSNDQKLFGQHDARWIKSGYPGEGNILIFNNGFLRPGLDFSSVDEIITPVDYEGNYYLESNKSYDPENPIWSYKSENPTDFYAPIQSGAQRLPNGNTLICACISGTIIEITPEKEIVSKYINIFPNLISPQVFTIQNYPLNYPGLGVFNQKNINICLKESK